jgi:hypothetical protein
MLLGNKCRVFVMFAENNFSRQRGSDDDGRNLLIHARILAFEERMRETVTSRQRFRIRDFSVR